MNWPRDSSRRLSYLRLVIQLAFFFLIFYIAIIGVGKFLILFIIMGITLFFGRFFCGWCCPFGFYMDLITIFRRSFQIPYWTFSQSINRTLHILRYVIVLIISTSALIFLLIDPIFPTQDGFDLILNLHFYPPVRPFIILLAPLEPLVIPFVPPFGAIFEFNGMALSFPYVGEIAAITYGTDFTTPLGILFIILIMIASFKVRRFWCRFCPTGISIAIINKCKIFKWTPLLHLFKVEEKCTKCGICRRVCPTQVEEIYHKKSGKINTSMCILCLRCIEMCPYENCLELNISTKTLFRSKNWLEL